MSEQTEPIAAAEAPAPSFSEDGLREAFAAAVPYTPTPQADPYAVAPARVAEISAPAEPAAVESGIAPPTPEPQAPVQPDYAAYLREQFGAETPEAIKSALETAKEAEALKANQRTAQDRAFEQLLSDPYKANEFLRLQSADTTTMPVREKLALQYALAHPELPAEIAALDAEEEYNQRYGAAEFDDPDDPAVRSAKLRLDFADKSATAAIEAAKTTARESLIAAAQPKEAEGPTPEQVAQQERYTADYLAGMDTVTGATPLDIAFTIDGKEVKVAFDNQSEEFKAAIAHPGEWLAQQAFPNGPDKLPVFDRLAVLVASAMQTETLVKNAYAAGKASLGPVIPLTAAVNPAPGAPQAPVGEMSIEDAIRQSLAQQTRRATY